MCIYIFFTVKPTKLHIQQFNEHSSLPYLYTTDTNSNSGKNAKMFSEEILNLGQTSL